MHAIIKLRVRSAARALEVAASRRGWAPKASPQANHRRRSLVSEWQRREPHDMACSGDVTATAHPSRGQEKSRAVKSIGEECADTSRMPAVTVRLVAH